MATYSTGTLCFSIDLKDAYLHIPIVKHYNHFVQFVRQHKPYQWKVFPVGWLLPQGFSPCSLNPYCLCHHKGL